MIGDKVQHSRIIFFIDVIKNNVELPLPLRELLQRVTHADVNSFCHAGTAKVPAGLVRIFRIAVSIENFSVLTYGPGKPQRGVSDSRAQLKNFLALISCAY